MGNTWLRDKAADIEEVTDHPEKQTCWHDESVVTAGNALESGVGTANPYNRWSRQNVAADSDTFQQRIFLAAGTYSFYVLGITDVDKAITDWFLDAVEIVTAQDWYSGSTVYDVKKTTISISIATSKVYTIKSTVDGKNGSSSAYNLSLQKFWFEKTA